MNLLELLRSQARKFRCPVCGESMADCGIKVLAQQGNRALVRVTCASCNDENLLQIIFQTDGEPIEQEGQRVATISEGIPYRIIYLVFPRQDCERLLEAFDTPL